MDQTGPMALTEVTCRRVLDLPGRERCLVWDTGPRQAPTLMLLHGATLNAELNWSRAVGTLAGRYRVVTFDLRGHGASPRGPSFRLEDCADDVMAIADALDLSRVIPVGYSLGGFIAQLVWRRHRHRVAGLVLCSTARHTGGSPWEHSLVIMLRAALAAATWSPACYPRGADLLWAGLLCAGLLDHDLDPAERAAALAHTRGTTTLLDALAILQAGSSFSSHGWIETVDVPTASVITLRDRVVPPHRQYTLARALPNNTVIKIDADHGAFLNAPDQFAAAVLAGCDLVCTASDHDGPTPLITAS
jgi:3-oxoadipate enol-lactonase